MDLLAIDNPAELIAARTAAIGQAVLQQSPRIKLANFERIDIDDLSLLMGLYDREFLGGWLAGAVLAATGRPLALRLSSTMTRAGGKTIKYRPRRARLGGADRGYFEIAVASKLLLMTFRDIQRAVVIGGLVCANRLEALQRIMEHEIIHLAELLMWEESSCSAVRFRRLARRIFGHTDTTHALVTPREQAAVRHGIKVGSMVQFAARGRRLTGRVNRISQRATVLVEDAAGQPYTDGHTYSKFYVPLSRLQIPGTNVEHIESRNTST